MKNKAKITKSIIAMSTIVSLGTGLAITSPNVANAAQIETRSQETAIQDVYKNIDNMLAAIPLRPGMQGFPWKRTTLLFGDHYALSGINITESNVTDVVPLFLGTNTFVNSTNQDQTYNTSAFRQEITKETSTEVQTGFTSSTTATGKVGIPFVADGEISETLEFNVSNTNTNTQSETNEITAPSQPVVVPANKTYKTEVYFEKKKTSGNVELYADVLTGAISNGELLSIGDSLDFTKNTYGLTKFPNDPDQVRSKGSGKFTIEYGTNLIVKTYDITSGARSIRSIDSGTLVDTKVIPLK
ncbi:epsilon-toxin family protein [Bacillus cereus]|uniref:ETX/MTX2 family pore-forming toxin n=1 Tax=Bacillus cereus TaxID=1396 RepID=UPI001D0F13EF|nr:ETX/MTX2 family pore-forming toxin [Bacillus cereus]MCC2364654.1 epsilon-toxin family protein [Bacillus cereus]